MRIVIAGVTLWLIAACGASPPSAEKTDKQTSKKVDDKTSKPGAALSIPAFRFGPYGGSASGAEAQHFIELGYIDRREVRGDQDMSDDRQFHASLAKLEPSAIQAPGCAAVTPIAANADSETPSLSGEHDGELSAGDDGVWRADVKLVVDMEGDYAMAVGATDSVDLPSPPTFNGIRMAGAYDAELSVIIDLGTLTTALTDAEDDMLFGDSSDSGGYDVGVITLHGGSDAKIKHLRCVFEVGGTASAPASLYHQVLPLRRITWQVAALGENPWRSRFVGQAIEDLRVP